MLSSVFQVGGRPGRGSSSVVSRPSRNLLKPAGQLVCDGMSSSSPRSLRPYTLRFSDETLAQRLANGRLLQRHRATYNYGARRAQGGGKRRQARTRVQTCRGCPRLFDCQTLLVSRASLAAVATFVEPVFGPICRRRAVCRTLSDNCHGFPAIREIEFSRRPAFLRIHVPPRPNLSKSFIRPVCSNADSIENTRTT